MAGYLDREGRRRSEAEITDLPETGTNWSTEKMAESSPPGRRESGTGGPLAVLFASDLRKAGREWRSPLSLSDETGGGG